MTTKPYLFIVSLAAATLLSACSNTPEQPPAEVVQQKEVSQPEFSAQELFLQGNEALDQKDYERAISRYERALQQAPDRWDIYLNKAIALSTTQQFSEAISAIDQALTNGGDTRPEVYFNLGNIYQNRGLYGQSIKAYRTSLSLREQPHVDTIVNIAAALMFMRETDEAEKTYNYLKTLAPDDPRIYLGLGLLEQMRDNYKGALEHYDHVILIDPTYAQVYYNKGALLYATKQFSSAIDSFQRYLEVAPDGPYAERAQNRIEALKRKK